MLGPYIFQSREKPPTVSVHSAAWRGFPSVYRCWQRAHNWWGKWPRSNYTRFILPPLRCHCHLAGTGTSGGRRAVCPAIPHTQSPYIQMGRGHLKNGCRLGYYYLDGGSKAIDRWMPSGWKADVPGAAKIHQHILTLATQERVHSRQELYQRGDECAERCQWGASQVPGTAGGALPLDQSCVFIS